MLFTGRVKFLAETFCCHTGLSIFVTIVLKDKNQTHPDIIMSQWFGIPERKDLAYLCFELLGRSYFPTSRWTAGPPSGYDPGLAESANIMVLVSGESSELNHVLACLFLWTVEIPHTTLLNIKIAHPSQGAFDNALLEDQKIYHQQGIARSKKQVFILVPRKEIPKNLYFVNHTLEASASYELCIVTEKPQALRKMIANGCGLQEGTDIVVPCKDKIPFKITFTDKWVDPTTEQ